MDEEYDVIVCGTGLKECILSGLLSVAGKKVLHLDRNGYYGGDAASLNITNLWQKFKPNEKPPESLGANRDWNVDLIPKFVMANGLLVKMLLHTGVTRYLEWKSVDGTYVYQYQEAGFFSSEKFIHKVPATAEEAMSSNLMSLMEKNRARSFFQFVAGWKGDDPSSWQGVDPARHSMQQVYDKFGLQPGTIDFMGHCVALHEDDRYLQMACGATIEKMKLYMESISRYGNSPFIYPIYGLGGLPEGFSRLSAIHGGTYMLNKPVDGFEYDESGRVCGVRSGNEVAKTKLVICDPSYVPDNKRRAVGQVIRAICILGGPIPNTDDKSSAQIILTASQMNRKNDIYVMMVSNSHCVSAKNKYIAIVSTMVETQNPSEEIKPALRLLGNIEHIMCTVSTLFVPSDAGTDGVFVTSSYDATSHFESASQEVMNMWRHIFGQDLELTVHKDALAE